MLYPKAFQSLIAHFSSLPSIGPKAAERIVLYLFKQDATKLQDFAESFEALQELKSCTQCFHIAEDTLCTICEDTHRQQNTLCVVEEALDVIALERAGSYHGLYHVLGGVLETSRNATNSHLRVAELIKRLEHGVTEVILATNPTTEGDLTAMYLKKKLEPYDVKVTRIGRGMSTGGDIEYADELTLRAALDNRTQA